jgi:hypothetical protein
VGRVVEEILGTANPIDIKAGRFKQWRGVGKCVYEGLIHTSKICPKTKKFATSEAVK